MAQQVLEEPWVEGMTLLEARGFGELEGHQGKRERLAVGPGLCQDTCTPAMGRPLCRPCPGRLAGDTFMGRKGWGPPVALEEQVSIWVQFLILSITSFRQLSS